jgi:hypothetical protein
MSGQSFTRLLKFALITTDAIIFLSGLIMLIGGSVVQAQINRDQLAHKVGGYSTQAGSIICILFGLTVLLMSLFGLYSTFKDHHRFLIVYCIIMGLVFLIQFITGIVGLSVKNSEDFNANVAHIVEPLFEFDHNNTETNFYQKHFKCCGWDNYTSFMDGEILKVPASCCKDPSTCDPSSITENDEKLLWQTGCKSILVVQFRKVIEGACGILVSMSIITLISIALSILLARQIRTGYQHT